MLRTFVLVVAAIGFTFALFGAIVDPGVWPTAIVTGLLVAGIAFERVRYGAAQPRPSGADWQETSERFVDYESGRPMTVWIRSATGERRYVIDGEGGA